MWSIGVNASEMMHGKKGVGEMLADNVGDIMDALSPVNLNFSEIEKGKFPARSFIPTVGVPLYDIYKNEDFTGRPVYKVPFTKEGEEYTPNTELAQGNVNSILKGITDFLNKAGGGNEFTPAGYSVDENGKVRYQGWKEFVFDWNPSKIEHALEYYLGGRGKFFNDVFKTAKASVKPDEDVKTYNIPVLKRLYMTPYDGNGWQDYFEIGNEVRNYKHFMKQAEDTENFDMQESLYNNSEMQEISDLYDTYTDELKNTKELLELLTDPDDQKELKDERDKLIKDFVQEVIAIRKEYEQKK